MKNFIYNNIILFFMLLILNLCFTINVYASRDEGNGQDTDKLPEGITFLSNFEGGFIQIGWNIKNKDGQTIPQTYKYYKCVTGKNEYGELTTVYLYNLSNSLHDEELEQAVKNKTLDTDTLYDIYSLNAKEIKNPRIYTSSYFMWPMSSNGDTLILPDTQNKEELIKSHDIHDFSEISKPENFCLAATIPGNWNSTLSSNLPDGYIYPVQPSSVNYKAWLQQAITKIGSNYKNRYNLNGGNRHFPNTSQTFINHISYLTEGSQTAAITKTLQAKNNYDPTKDEFNTNKKSKEYYEQQYFFFLTTPEGQHVAVQRAYSATNLLKESGCANFPRSTQNSKIPTDFNMNPIVIFNYNNIVPNHFKFKTGSALYNLELEKAVPGFSSTNKLSTINYEDIPPIFMGTFQSLVYCYPGAYWKLTDLASKSWVDINSVFPEFNSMLTIEQFTEMAKQDYKLYYKMECVLTLTMAKYYLIDGYASKNSPASINWINYPGTTYGGRELPVLDYTSITLANNVTSGDVQINNYITEDIYSSLVIIDLVKALDVTEQDFSKISLGQAPNIDKRKLKLIQAAIKNENIGIHLLKSEVERGKIEMVGNNLENLYPNRPYVMCASISYEKNIPPEKIPKILNKDEIYNIANYKDIKLDEKQEDKKEEQ